ncbi:MAG TPA: hypothetical protein VF656_03345 [Pyrinomonadaceae bacterium]|jgi:hypothetical protein
MALKKRTSKIFDHADLRANGMQSIAPDLSFANNLMLAKFKQLIADGRAKLDDYNQTLASADQKANDVAAAEQAVRDYSGRMLADVAAMYGKNSNEYEQSGGTRTSERKRVAPKKSPAPQK